MQPEPHLMTSGAIAIGALCVCQCGLGELARRPLDQVQHIVCVILAYVTWDEQADTRSPA